MRGFLREVAELYGQVRPTSVLEVGCGEGHLAQHLLRSAPRPQRFVACDLEIDRIAADLDPAIEVQQASIYALPFEAASFDLVVCCEVLEHLEDPRAGLAELARVAARRVLISTPWDPVWRALNMARGRYLGALGNTPGHIQHFTRRSLAALARTQLRVLERRTPLPWTILLGEPLR
ncbi:MAG: class I SAM-dependent methyltransferase [Deltaproteobacteria bacterium]|nr:class I SAM-dependent methyltransferase [Nannocystaceae bacterium]